jgi:hypothetical protein
MNELCLWQWRYTDEFGKRRIFPCRLTGEGARHLRDAERVRRVAGDPQAHRTDQRLAALIRRGPDDAAKIIWKYLRRTLDHFHRTNEDRFKNVRGFIFRTASS